MKSDKKKGGKTKKKLTREQKHDALLNNCVRKFFKTYGVMMSNLAKE